MGAYSTIRVSRRKAKEILLEHLAGDVTDEILKAFMDDWLDDGLRNCRIVPDDEMNDDDEV